MGYRKEREVAVEAVLQACRLCRMVQENLVTAETLHKKDRSPVTVADFGAQALANRVLGEAFPDDPVVGEEDAAELRGGAAAEIRARVVEQVRRVRPALDEEAILAAIDRGGHQGGGTGRHWTLDPIDGTKGFLRREQYAVALALIEEGEVVLGVLGCPNLPLHPAERAELEGEEAGSRRSASHAPPSAPAGSLFIAARGRGTVVRGLEDPDERPVRVSDLSDPGAAIFCESVESGHSSHGDAARVAEILGVQAPPLRMDSQAKYGAVARGDAAIYLRLPTRAGYEERIWDHAAGALVIREAGGEVTDVRGRPLDFSLGRTLRENVGVVATNGRLHASVLAAVRQVLAL